MSTPPVAKIVATALCMSSATGRFGEQAPLGKKRSGGGAFKDEEPPTGRLKREKERGKETGEERTAFREHGLL